MSSDNNRLAPTNSPISIRPRGYQFEMFERSMQENVIVAMDTGSGKTHVALLRIIAEIDRCPQGKRIWFLAPTVDLCAQQHESIKSYLPASRTRLLVGSDGVDRWRDERIWNAILDKIQIVVSTHAVLADALRHGFVTMESLALLIFDEGIIFRSLSILSVALLISLVPSKQAHHCSRDHPANKIMQVFYHPLKEKLGPSMVPHILGLSASPIARSKISELSSVSPMQQGVLRRIEANLDAISITPRINRQELFRHVHRPTIYRLDYESCGPDDDKKASLALSCLQDLCKSMKIQFGHVLPQPGQLLHKLPKKSKGTSLETQLQKFCNKAIHIYEELGPWASDYFILESINDLSKHKNNDAGGVFAAVTSDHESLLRILDEGKLNQLRQLDYMEGPFAISAKVERLLSFLGSQDAENCSGLLFVRQRATVSVLCKLLSLHPEVQNRFKCATFVGMSNKVARKYSMAELLDLKAQRDTLAEFRARKRNLIIATDVLEEGIDVTACNLVLCFDPPPNVKSFIQRRGRARQEKSQFAIMFPIGEGGDKLQYWQNLEETLVKTYQAEQREIADLRAMEDGDDEAVPGTLMVESTGACITPDAAISHLHHFCACLPREQYVDLRPTFSFSETSHTRLISATVALPSSLIPSVRSTTSIRQWRTERCAAQDASFQAYKALYEAGLLNDNLLPLSRSWVEDGEHGQEEIGAIVGVGAELNPWKQMAKCPFHQNLYQTRIIVKCDGDTMLEDLSMVLTTPATLPTIFPILLWWDDETRFRLHFGTSSKVTFTESGSVETLRRITHLLTRSSRSDYTKDNRNDFVALFSPKLEEDKLSAWFEANRGRISAVDLYTAKVLPRGLVRSSTLHGIPHQFHNWSNSTAESPCHVDVRCFPLTRRRNFVTSSNLPPRKQPFSGLDIVHSSLRSFPIQEVTVDRLPFEFVRFGLFMQTILRQVRSVILADTLRSTLLKDLSIKDIRHIITAISAPSAGLVTDYQCYEFFGDAVLKFVVSQELFFVNENWHEGFLTKRKSWLVSNQHLAKAALEQGLDVFIMTEGFKSKKWTPPLISELLKDSDQPRELSTKVLADVVEALIGATYLDGGFDLARRCVHIFLPEIPIVVSWAKRLLPTTINTDRIADAETIIGYEFDSKILLLESLTHPSYDNDTTIESYQRLEFLGDAVLDMLIVRLLASSECSTAASPGTMTLIKAALVNTHFLGFLCLDYGKQSTVVKRIEETTFGCFEEKLVSRKVSLWELMRHTNKDIKSSQDACWARYADQQETLHCALIAGTTFPWVPLSRLHLDKFYSDMIESIIGAIFVDSKGNLEACEEFIARIGLVAYLKRVLTEKVDVRHPKTILGQLAGLETVSYQEEIVLEKSEDTIEKRHKCVVTVGEAEIAVAEDCLSKEEAVWTAAVLAAESLRKRTK